MDLQHREHLGGIALAAGVPCGGGYCEGTTGDDTMYGSTFADQMYGIGGNDTMHGGDGADSMWGDWHQVIDTGEPGSDTMYGGNGPDRLQGDERREKDFIDCGRGGEDVAFFDKRTDEVRNCEIRNPPVG